jgi:D-alanyl-D-alanine carboxypeptidase
MIGGFVLRYPAILSLFIALLAAAPASAARYASIIVDERTGNVLHAVNPDSRVYPASLTKMMTLYLVFEALEAKRITPDLKMKVSRRASRRPKSKLGLKKGQTITVKQAIAALVTKSANDVATVVAEAIGGTEEKFAQFMTARAYQLGMTRTVFRNASGLPDKRQVSTARDMARLSMALRRDFPKYFHLFSMPSFKYRGRKYGNHNSLLKYYRGTDGIKTGYVRDSGYNIAVSVNRNGHRLIGVLFGGKSAGKRDRKIKGLFQRTFRMLAEANPAKAYRVSRAGGDNSANAVALARIAPAPRVNTVAEFPHEQWTVQVGAFSRFAPAHLAATRAARLAPTLRRARVSIEAGAAGRNKVYRARLVGLSGNSARLACSILKKKKFTCLVSREDSDIAQGDR